MSRTRKIVTIVLAVIGLSFIGLCGWGYHLVTRSLPQTEGTLVIPGLSQPAAVFRDGYHVPHILTGNQDDLFLVQGFITAQDRFWQMELSRRKGSGRLSEILGGAFAGTDSLMRTVGLHRTAKKMIPWLSHESRRAYEEYTEGVNLYLRMMGNKLPLEFNLLGCKPEPWSVADCIVVFRTFFFSTGEPWQISIVLASLIEKLGSEKAAYFFPDDHDSNPRQWWSGPVFSQFLEQNAYASAQFPHAGLLKPGHNWVVSAARSGLPGALLATAPCLPVEIPSVLYENHLSGGSYNSTGVSIPGFPGVIMGQNKDIAWSFSRPVTNDKTIFLENASQRSGWEQIEEKILIRLGDTLALPVQMTHRSTLLPFSGRPPEKRLGFSWSGTYLCDEAAVFLDLNRAPDWDGFRQTLSHFNLFPMRFIYGDSRGNIGLQDAGTFNVEPSFLPVNPVSGPVDDLIPFTGLLSAANPPEGYLTDSAGSIPGEERASTDTRFPCRAGRLLEAQKEMDIRHIKMMQSDDYTQMGTAWRDMIVRVFHGTEDPLMVEAVELLEGWDGRMKTGSGAAALYAAFITELAGQTLLGELGETLFNMTVAMDQLVNRGLLKMLQSGHFSAESRKAALGTALKAAMEILSAHYGENPGLWSWGGLHQMDFSHLLGGNPLLRKSLNRGPFQLGGDGSTLRTTGYRLAPPYTALWANTARMVLDTGNPDNSAVLLAPGQSGHALDEHYRDQIQLYLSDMYHATLMDTSKIRISGWKKLDLLPESIKSRQSK